MRRPYDASIQIRTHRTTLATLALFYESSGIPVTSISGLVRRALEDFKDACVLQAYVGEVQNSGEASDILDRLNMRSGARTQRQFLTNLQLDEFKADGIAPVSRGDKLIGGVMPTTFQPEDEPTLDVIRKVPDNLIVKEEETNDENGDDEGGIG